MIVRCPECETGYNLSPEKVPSSGAKLRCSKCDHVFRVRIGSKGVLEVFYKEGERPNNTHNETQLGVPARSSESPRETAQLSVANGGGATNFGSPRGGTSSGVVPLKNKKLKSPPVVKAVSLRAPILTPPGIQQSPPPLTPRANNVTPVLQTPPQIPTKKAKRHLTPIPSEELDLFGDESGFDFANKNNESQIGEDPFLGAFDDPEEEPSIFGEAKDEPNLFGEIESPSPPKKNIEAQTIQRENQPPPLKTEESERSEKEEDLSFFNQGGTSRDYASLTPEESLMPETLSVDPNTHSTDSRIPDIEAPYIEAQAPKKKKKVNKPTKEAVEEKLELAIKRAPKKPVRRPHLDSTDSPKRKSSKKRSAQSKSTSKKSRSSRPQPSTSPKALKPHKIGGNTLRRFGDTLFIGLILTCAFVGFIAYKNGGFFDFSAPLHMLEVAFDGKEYQPRKALKESILNHDSSNAVPLHISEMSAIPYRIESKDYVIIVNGFIINPGEKIDEKKSISVEITTKEGVEKQNAYIGEHLTIAQLHERIGDETFSTLAKSQSVEGKARVPFFAVFRRKRRFRELSVKALLQSSE